MKKELTSKERSILAGMASKENAIFQVGKEGISDTMIRALSSALDARELVKISVLKNSEDEAKDVAEDLAKKLMADIVRVIGNKVILYRYSSKKDFEHILNPKK